MVVTRFGIVLGKDGGALDQMVPLFKKFLGGTSATGSSGSPGFTRPTTPGPSGSSRTHPEISGPVNLTAPYPVRNRELTRALGRVLHRPTFMSAPAFMVRLALGEFADTLLTGQQVLPQRLMDAGFKFTFPTIEAALTDLLGQGSKK